MRPTAKPIGKSRPVDLACAEDRPLWVKRSLLSPANVNPSVVTAQPQPRFRRIGQCGHEEHALPRQRSGLWRDPTRRSGDPGYRLRRCARVPPTRLTSVSLHRELCEGRCVRRSLSRCARHVRGCDSLRNGARFPRGVYGPTPDRRKALTPTSAVSSTSLPRLPGDPVRTGCTARLQRRQGQGIPLCGAADPVRGYLRCRACRP